jgi:hypothetical protein
MNYTVIALTQISLASLVSAFMASNGWSVDNSAVVGILMAFLFAVTWGIINNELH